MPDVPPTIAEAITKATPARSRRWLFGLLLPAVLALGGAAAWWLYGRAPALPAGIVSTNGRIEAEQFDIATKVPGRVAEVLVEEGQMVEEGAVIARLDAATAEAQLRAAEAQMREAEQALAQAATEITRARSARDLARVELNRAVELSRGGFATAEQLDRRRNAVDGAEATLAVALAGQRRAAAAVEAVAALVAQYRTALQDLVLLSPHTGRVLYRLVHPREVLPAGGRVATLIDPTDVSMIIFLPAGVAGRLADGAEARLVLDPIPQFVIPATVSFVSPEAQFTPRQVETAAERESLMFRVKLRLPRDLLERHADRVRGGVRGMAYVRTDASVDWPPGLAVRLP